MSPAANKGKIAGVALIAVAAAALVVGIVTAVTSGGSGNQASGQGPRPVTGSHAPGAARTGGSSATHGASHTAKPSATSTSSSTSSHTTRPPLGATTTVIAAPPAGNNQNGEAQQAAQRSGADKSAPVRVYNNSTIKGLASRAAADIRRDGYHVVEVSNYPGGVIPTTTVYYRPGTHEQGTADSLAKAIGARVAPRFAGIQHASPGVILIVTKDYQAS
ncbi:MAG: LytR C-terminal domain-containing protein [Sciscionella sp.]